MELSPSWEAVSCAATKDLPSNLWNSKVHYRVHRSSPLVPIVSQINPVHTTPSYLSKIHFNIPNHLRLVLPSGLFPSGLPTNILQVYAHLFAPFVLHALPSHPLWLDHSNYTWRRVQVMKFLIMHFSPISRHIEVSGQLHAPPPGGGGNSPGTHCIGGWVGPRPNLDGVDKRTTCCPCRESNPDSSVVQPAS
jgi:hypothetical protein